MRKTTVLAAVALFGMATTAQAAEIYKDYAPSKAVWNVTMVKVKPNRVDDYLDGLKKTWVSGCEISKKQGVLEDCSIFISETTAGGPFNVMLVQKFTSAGAMDPDEARYNAFMTEMRKGLEKAKQDELVQTYEDFRTFWGEMNFRRVEWK